MREVLDKQVIEALTFPSFKFIMLHAILSTALFEWILITSAVDFLGLGIVLMPFHTSPVFLVRVVNNIHVHIVNIVCPLKPKYMRVTVEIYETTLCSWSAFTYPVNHLSVNENIKYLHLPVYFNNVKLYLKIKSGYFALMMFWAGGARH